MMAPNGSTGLQILRINKAIKKAVKKMELPSEFLSVLYKYRNSQSLQKVSFCIFY